MAIAKLSGLAAAVLIMSMTPVTDAAAAVTVTSHFAYVTTASRTADDSAYIDNGATNNNPNSLLFVTPNWDPGNLCNCAFLDVPTGVRYDQTEHMWAASREDGLAMPANEAFNVLAVPHNKVDSTVFTVTADAQHIHGSGLRLDNPNLNGHPARLLQVTQNFNPGGNGAGVANPHNIGVRYNLDAQKWVIFNEDQASMPVGASFNVLIGNTRSNGGALKLLTATSSNLSGDHVTIANGQTTGNPNNVTFATHVFNPGGTSTGRTNNAQIGVYYDGGSDHEAVFNEDTSDPPLGSGYNLLIFPS